MKQPQDKTTQSYDLTYTNHIITRKTYPELMKRALTPSYRTRTTNETMKRNRVSPAAKLKPAILPTHTNTKLKKMHSFYHKPLTEDTNQLNIILNKQLKQRLAIIFASPIISSLDCLALYPSFAAVNLMQSSQSGLIEALKKQHSQPNGIYHGMYSFWCAKIKSRLFGLTVSTCFINENPSFTSINNAAFAGALAETLITNRDLAKQRYKVIQNTSAINLKLLQAGSKFMFPTHLFKNFLTLALCQNIFHFTPVETLESFPLDPNYTKGLITGFSIMMLQLLGASHLDTAMTYQLKEKIKNPQSNASALSLIKKVFKQPFGANFNVSLTRAAIFGIGYAGTFTCIGAIKNHVDKTHQEDHMNQKPSMGH